MENNRVILNTCLLKVAEEIDPELAVKAISDPNLDGRELSEILTASLMGTLVDKTTGEPVKISNKVLMAGILNKLNQIERDMNKETE
jgi:hypothetical protein